MHDSEIVNSKMLQAEQILNERYQLKQKLGQNAGRQTWLAEDIATQEREPVVVKLLAFGGDVQWDDLKLFEREAQVLKQLNHARIPKYRDYFSIDERSLWFGLVHDYIPGSSLKEQLASGKKFAEREVRKLASDVLNILIYLHELSPPVLHRDIKPSNLIWGEDGQVYLVDFGAVQDKAVKEGATFTVVGTYGYAPMEQFGGRAVPASDLYALGATLIHLLTGTAPADLPQDDLRIQFSDKVSAKPDFIRWVETLADPSLKRRFSSAQQALKSLKTGLFIISRTPNPSQIDKNSRVVATRVQLNKSLARLEINIPLRGIKAIDIPFVTLKMIFVLFLVSLVPGFGQNLVWFLMLLPVLLIVGRPTLEFHFGRIFLDFNRNNFKIERRLFGMLYYQLEWPTFDIQYVFSREKNYSREVVIQVDNSFKFQQYSFGQGLTQDEIAWLTQEIQSWLNVR